jgi:hypothetical protein
MTKASRSPRPVETDMGSAREQLTQPELAAELTVAETTEIKERKRLIEQEAERLLDQQKILQLLRMEQQRYLQSLITGKGLSLADDFNLDAEAGVVWRTARAVPMSPQVVDDAPVVEAAEAGAELVEV